MIELNNVGLQFGGKMLFKDVNLTFTKGNCYGVIGANGAGKSTFLKLLSKEIDTTAGTIRIEKGKRMSFLRQNHQQFDDMTVIETVLYGHQRLTEIMKEREKMYAQSEFSEADGIKIAELETEFAELDGYEADSAAASLLVALGVDDSKHQMHLAELDSKDKVRILLAQALFGNPDILLLDEPTNGLDVKATRWLENFLYNFPNTVIVVSHDRHFLNKVSTHILDIDFTAIRLFVGNYDFWYESSQLIEKQLKDQNKKSEQRAKELEEFIARFSANASKSRQATSRKKELDKIQIADLKPSNRRYPFIDFRPEKEIGNDVLIVDKLTKKPFFENLSFTINRSDKVLFVSSNSMEITTLFNVLLGLEEADSGTIKWGITTNRGYFPQNNQSFFTHNYTLLDWLGQYTKDKSETHIRGWLGRMLFNKDDVFKKTSVISGGEKVRLMLAKLMLEAPNVLLLDNPTNHLDLEAITVLNKGMINYRGVILFTTHDQEIAATAANRVIAIENQKVFDKVITYEEYLDTIS